MSQKKWLMLGLGCLLMLLVAGCEEEWGFEDEKVVDLAVPDWVSVQLISVDGASRRGLKLQGVHDVVVHYVGNPNTTAQQNRDYFASDQSEVSSHFLVGLEGEIIQCVPLDEISTASNWRNKDTISIEVCHPDATGVFTAESYESLVQLVAWLCESYELDSNQVIRHFDVTGKICPRYFVHHEEAWLSFKEDVKMRLNQ